MVGHTHEDIDQHFSCLSRYLRKNSAVTMEGELYHKLQGIGNRSHMANKYSCICGDNF